MPPTETMEPEAGGLGQARLQEIIYRLKEVRRRCAGDPVVTGRRNAAVEGLAAVLNDLEAGQGSTSEPMGVEDLNRRLATVERRFEVMGSHGVARVVASIRSSLGAPPEDASPGEEPPPPRRFQPSPGSAVRRRRPRPKTRQGRARAAPATAHKGRFGWLSLTIVAAAAIAIAAVGYFRWIEPQLARSEQPEPMLIEKPVVSTLSTSTAPARATSGSGSKDEFDLDDEDMARFTFEINLAESALQEGDLHGSLRHFAAAAAIDRQNRRVVGMGKSLIAALLREADLAYDSGDRELARKRLQNAHSIARGLQLVGFSEDDSAPRDAPMTRFDDIEARTGESLQTAVGHTVRLTLKTRGVIFGYLIEINDDVLLLDAYSGAKDPDIDSAVSILASTIDEVRVYDAI